MKYGFFGILFLMSSLSFASHNYTDESSRASVDLKGIEASISLVAPEVFNVGFCLGANLDFKIFKYLHFVPGFEYTHAWYNYDYYPSGVYPYNSYPNHSLNEFAFDGDIRFYFPLTTVAIRPYVGGGMALLVVNEIWHDYYNDPNYSNTYPGIAADFITGLDFPTSFLTWNVELKGKVGTGFNMFKFTGGVKFPI